MRMFQVDAFTDRLFAGNPAAVLILDAWPDDARMLAIAQELALGAPVVRDRLDKLKALGLVREEAQGRRLIYHLMPRAEGFFPLLLSIADWGDRWCNGDQPPPDPRLHECGALLRGRYRCRHCQGWIRRDQLELRFRG